MYENGKAHLRRLDVEADHGAQVAVRAGLNSSDQLILNPPIGLVEGMPMTTASEARPIAGTQPAAELRTLNRGQGQLHVVEAILVMGSPMLAGIHYPWDIAVRTMRRRRD